MDQMRGANKHLFIAGNEWNYMEVFDWTGDMQTSISTLFGLTDDVSHIYVSKAVANQISFTTYDHFLYFASYTGTTLAVESSVALGTDYWPIAIVPLEEVQKLIVFYETEGTYFIIDEGAGHAK